MPLSPFIVFITIFATLKIPRIMSRVKFTAQQERDIQAFYTEEKIRLEAKLSHVNSILSQYGVVTKKVFSSETPQPRVSKTSTKKKRRGPKSKWGKFIVGRLRARQKPMSYEELIDDAISLNKIPELDTKQEQVFLTVLSVLELFTVKL